MELGLSLGDASRYSRPFGFLAKEGDDQVKTTAAAAATTTTTTGLGFCMALGIKSNGRQEQEREKPSRPHDVDKDDESDQKAVTNTRRRNGGGEDHRRVSVDRPLQLDLLPHAPVPRSTSSLQQVLSWPSDNASSEGVSSGQMGLAARGFDVNRPPPRAAEEAEEGVGVSSPNSVASSFRMDFCVYRGAANVVGGNKRDFEAAGNDGVEVERASSRASDEEENGLTRKKLRLSKEQSAYLEESFKEHNTLNPKQKLALAKQLNLRPRQVEVWFQNRRARTKLKQTEVDCEYLRRCCETLTEENRRLHKELQELRALKTSNPFYMQLPATTLTMCPSCERVANTAASSADPSTKTTPFPLSSRARFLPFSHAPPQPHQPSVRRED